MKRRLFIAAIVAVLAGCLAVMVTSRRLNVSSQNLRVARELLTVHAAMRRDSLAGFLPGTSPRLPEDLRRRRFTYVSVLPDMIMAGHGITAPAFRVGTSIDLVRSSTNAGKWTVSRTVMIGRRAWTSRIATMDALEETPTNSSAGGPPASALSPEKARGGKE